MVNDDFGAGGGGVVDLPAPPVQLPGARAVAGCGGVPLSDEQVDEAVAEAQRLGWPSWRPLNRTEAAAFLGKAAATLAEWARTGYGPPFRMDGGRSFYDISALIRWRAQPGRRR